MDEREDIGVSFYFMWLDLGITQIPCELKPGVNVFIFYNSYYWQWTNCNTVLNAKRQNKYKYNQ